MLGNDERLALIYEKAEIEKKKRKSAIVSSVGVLAVILVCAAVGITMAVNDSNNSGGYIPVSSTDRGFSATQSFVPSSQTSDAPGIAQTVPQDEYTVPHTTQAKPQTEHAIPHTTQISPSTEYTVPHTTQIIPHPSTANPNTTQAPVPGTMNPTVANETEPSVATTKAPTSGSDEPVTSTAAFTTEDNSGKVVFAGRTELIYSVANDAYLKVTVINLSTNTQAARALLSRFGLPESGSGTVSVTRLRLLYELHDIQDGINITLTVEEISYE